MWVQFSSYLLQCVWINLDKHYSNLKLLTWNKGFKLLLKSSRQTYFHGIAKNLWWLSSTFTIVLRVVALLTLPFAAWSLGYRILNYHRWSLQVRRKSVRRKWVDPSWQRWLSSDRLHTRLAPKAWNASDTEIWDVKSLNVRKKFDFPLAPQTTYNVFFVLYL